MNKYLLLTLLALGYQSASATTVIENFGGTGANAFSMEFVTIGNPAGSVAYTYNLGKYEVSRGQIDKANAAGSLAISMQNMDPAFLWFGYGGNGLNKPATGITWTEAAKYVNWLNTSQGHHKAYNFIANGTFQLWSSTDAGYNANNMFRNSLAKYVIASRDEWYKGAYGKADGSWSYFPNGSDSAPTKVAGGTVTNTAVYGQSFSTGPADINNAGGLSAYGTMGQGGNVWEWNETAYDGSNNTAGENRELRGGSWDGFGHDGLGLGADWRDSTDPSSGNYDFGFRVASVPEPSTGLLVLLGLSGLLLKRRKTGTL